MRHHKRDQFAADMFYVQGQIKKETGVDVHFSLAQVNTMVATIERSRKTVADHDELRGFLMARFDFSNDEEYTAYERVLNRIFERRKAAA